MFEYSKNNFIKFISNSYDLKDDKVRHKLKHSFHVVDNSKYLCDKLNLDNETKEIAMIIALLHDIGRFDQAKELKNFREDINSYDHATLGAKLLFENNLIRSFVEFDKYDEIIKIAILSKDRKTPIDIWISYIAFIYGLYFDESLNYIRELDYVNKLVDRFNYKLKDTKDKMEQIRNKGNNFILNL